MVCTVHDVIVHWARGQFTSVDEKKKGRQKRDWRVSKEPSSKSARYIESSDSIAARRAVIQSTPGAIRARKAESGETAKGKSDTTMIKNTKGFTKSPLFRNANVKSRTKLILKASNALTWRAKFCLSGLEILMINRLFGDREFLICDAW